MNGDPTQMVAASANAWRDRALTAERELEEARAENAEVRRQTRTMRESFEELHRLLEEARQERDAQREMFKELEETAAARIGELEAALRREVQT